jgi:hypothetical protein
MPRPWSLTWSHMAGSILCCLGAARHGSIPCHGFHLPSGHNPIKLWTTLSPKKLRLLITQSSAQAADRMPLTRHLSRTKARSSVSLFIILLLSALQPCDRIAMREGFFLKKNDVIDRLRRPTTRYVRASAQPSGDRVAVNLWRSMLVGVGRVCRFVALDGQHFLGS